MPKFPYTPLEKDLDGRFRNQYNQNLKDIESDIKELNGGQLEAVEAAHEAQAQAGYAQDAGDYANERGLYASEQGDYAKAQADKVKQSVENLGDLEQRVEVELKNSQTQSTYAKEQADRLKETNDHFKSVGEYDPLVTYYPYNIVEYNGSSYICITVSTGNLPTDTTYFNLFASKGEKGDRGDTGERGLQGIQGEQGLKGEKGDPGTSFIWKGEYSPTKTYVINDTLAYNGSSYICIKNTTIGILPTDTNYFNLLSQRGIDGSGSIVTINGKSPDLNGNVQIDANEIGAILASEKGVAGGVAKLNEAGKPIDAFGNEVDGKVKKVNNIEPDENGNITIPTFSGNYDDLKNIPTNLETTTGSQSKADLAEQHAKEYTDQAIANANQGEVKSVNDVQPDSNGNITLSIPTKTSELINDSNFVTTESVTEVSTDLENHETKIASKTELGHVKVDGTSISISPDGVISATGSIDDTSNAPGSKTLIAGNMFKGYFGTVPASQLITGDNLAFQVGISVGTSQFSTTNWLKFAFQNKILFISMKPIRHSISWDNINTAGCVFGKNVIIDNLTYKVRLIKGALTDPSKDADTDRGARGSEWNALMLPIHQQSSTGTWDYPAYADPNVPDWGTRFTDVDLVTRPTGGNGAYSWCQETTTSISTDRVIRGVSGVSSLATYISSIADSRFGWRPVLELVQ